MKIVLACDHNGVTFKEFLKKLLVSQNHDCVDIGSFGEEKVDYPDYGIAAPQMVARGEADRGILVCGSGIGMAIAANKVRGIRAALCLNPEAALLARQHTDANVLTLAGWQLDKDDVRAIVENFLNAEFEGGRHKRRVDKILRYEERASREEA